MSMDLEELTKAGRMCVRCGEKPRETYFEWCQDCHKHLIQLRRDLDLLDITFKL